MKPHQQRVVEEKAELDAKLEKLNAFEPAAGAHCPSCKAAPPRGNLWRCDACGAGFDTFTTHAECPRCAKKFITTQCPSCFERNTIDTWFAGGAEQTEEVTNVDAKPIADVISYATDQAKQFRECAAHHSANRGAESVALRANEVLLRIVADLGVASKEGNANG